jgi:hypothetical protein
LPGLRVASCHASRTGRTDSRRTLAGGWFLTGVTAAGVPANHESS